MNPGKEQFRRMVTEFRNIDLLAIMRPMIVMRQELIGNDEFADRGGTDSPTQHNMREAILECDRTRRHFTHNPENLDLGDAIAIAIDPEGVLTPGQNPVGGMTFRDKAVDSLTCRGGLMELIQTSL